MMLRPYYTAMTSTTAARTAFAATSTALFEATRGVRYQARMRRRPNSGQWALGVGLALLLSASACGSTATPKTEARATASTSASSVESSANLPDPRPATPLEAVAHRLGHPAFASNPSYLAASADGRFVATSLGMAGAEIEVFDGSGKALGVLGVDLEQAVRALDFSSDGAQLLVSLTGHKSAAIRVFLMPELVQVEEITLPAEDASGWFERGAEAHFLADGSIVGCSGHALLRWAGNAAFLGKLLDLPSGAFLSTSSDKSWLIVSTPEAVSTLRSSAPTKVVDQRARKGTSAGAFPIPYAFVDDDGAMLFADGADTVLRSPRGKDQPLGAGRPNGLTRGLAAWSKGSEVELQDRKSGAQKTVRAARAFVAPSGAALYLHSGADQRNAVTALSKDEAFSDRTLLLDDTPAFISFGLGELFVLESSEVLSLDPISGAVEQHLALPSPRRPAGIFRTAHDVFVMAGPVWRLLPRGRAGASGPFFESAGQTHAHHPKSFVRSDGSTVVCAGDGRLQCQGQLVLAPGATALGSFEFGGLVLANGATFGEGEYTESGADLGVVASSQPPRLAETWVRNVDLWWMVPAEDGAVIVTMEGADRLARSTFVRRVTRNGVSAPCPLGRTRPSHDAGVALDPSGRRLAVPLVDEGAVAGLGGQLLIVDVDTCSVKQRELPARPVSVDFSPDGARLAVGLDDRTLLVLELE
ncbi:MAG: hypothetical protein U0271_22590 [Polyangiaceae bacterium]